MQFTVIFFTVLRKKGDLNKIKQPSSAFSKRISLRNPPTAFVEYLVTGKPAESSDETISQELHLFQKYRTFLKKMENLPKPAQECMDFFVNKLG